MATVTYFTQGKYGNGFVTLAGFTLRLCRGDYKDKLQRTHRCDIV